MAVDHSLHLTYKKMKKTNEPELFPDKMIEHFKAEFSRQKLEKESKQYQDILKHVERTTSSFCNLIDNAWYATTRSPYLHGSSVLLSGINDVCNSMNAVNLLFRKDYLNTAKREMRYLIETLAKYFFLDQSCGLIPVTEKTKRLDDDLKLRSIDVIDDIEFKFFSSKTKNNFLSSVKWFYSYTCSYVHPSHFQFEENLLQVSKKLFIGIEEYRRFSKELFRFSDILVSFVLHIIGQSYAGDLISVIYDHKADWPFHKGTYYKQISDFFNYKSEQKNV